MKKKILRVTKWLGMTPVVATCNACGREFKVATSSLSRLAEAQESLRAQFAEHKCAGEDSADKVTQTKSS